MHHASSNFTANPPRIIVADDHDWIREILVQVVQQTLPSAEIIAARDGVQALEGYRQGGCSFLITNHAMPEMDGAELIRRVRQHERDLPILMVSVHRSAAADAETSGANWFLTKEQIMEHLPTLLQRQVGQRVTADTPTDFRTG